MAAEATSQTRYDVGPMFDKKMIIVTHTKASATDYITCSAYGITTVLWAMSKVLATGADDPCTWATSVVTFTTGTGASSVLVVGT